LSKIVIEGIATLRTMHKQSPQSI